MGTGAITSYIDVAQIVLYLFWAFFAGLIYYLHREDKREGYPLDSERSGNVVVQGWPAIPEPKQYYLRDGRVVDSPNFRGLSSGGKSRPSAAHLGAPIDPVGDPMLAEIGPGTWSERADVPDLTLDDEPRILPLRKLPGFDVDGHDPDPRGMPVVTADGRIAGTVRDIWLDRSDVLFRYLEVEVNGTGGARRLLPMNFTRVLDRQVNVASIEARHFAHVPATRQPDLVTLLEEDKIMAFYGAGTLYANPSRQEPLL